MLLFVLLAPALVLAGAVVGLADRGPAGTLAAVLLVAATVAGSGWGVAATRRWWRRTGARR